ncbi:hypothetical protein EZS27_008296 [termite gut metagenome]|uniref:HK97 gp10 family phage protein n=1 Tax=termite gut metagenome TaxID=433724 RepID=A0A5J4SCZ9_9ZZZZ
MNNYEFDINTKSVTDMFNDFDKKLRKKTLVNVLKKSANILRKQTISNLKSVVKNIDRKDKYNNTLRKGIKVSVAKNSESVKVHLLGNYKLKWFELGTVPRYAKNFKRKKMQKERYTGSIKRYNFFANAKQQTETQVFNSIEENLTAIIKQINEKYKNK